MVDGSNPSAATFVCFFMCLVLWPNWLGDGLQSRLWVFLYAGSSPSASQRMVSSDVLVFHVGGGFFCFVLWLLC